MTSVITLIEKVGVPDLVQLFPGEILLEHEFPDIWEHGSVHLTLVVVVTGGLSKIPVLKFEPSIRTAMTYQGLFEVQDSGFVEPMVHQHLEFLQFDAFGVLKVLGHTFYHTAGFSDVCLHIVVDHVYHRPVATAGFFLQTFSA